MMGGMGSPGYQRVGQLGRLYDLVDSSLNVFRGPPFFFRDEPFFNNGRAGRNSFFLHALAWMPASWSPDTLDKALDLLARCRDSRLPPTAPDLLPIFAEMSAWFTHCRFFFGVFSMLSADMLLSDRMKNKENAILIPNGMLEPQGNASKADPLLDLVVFTPVMFKAWSDTSKEPAGEISDLVITSAIALEFGAPRISIIEGIGSMARGDVDEAIAAFTRWPMDIHAKTSGFDVFKCLAHAFLEKGDFVTAANWTRLLLSVASSDEASWFLNGVALFLAGHLNEAIHAFYTAAQLDPNPGVARSRLKNHFIRYGGFAVEQWPEAPRPVQASSGMTPPKAGMENYNGLWLVKQEWDVLKEIETAMGGRTIPQLKPTPGQMYPFGFHAANGHVLSLGLYGRGLRALPEDIGRLSWLEELHLGENLLEALPASFTQLGSLDRLMIYSNKLKQLPEDLDKLKSLRVLSLAKNQLQCLPESIGNLTRLLLIDASRNALVSMPRSIGKLVNLKELYLEHNELDTLPDELTRLKSLDVITLQGNKLGHVSRKVRSWMTRLAS